MADRDLFEWIKREESEGRIYQEVDGYWVWAPTAGGFVDERGLTKMLEYLHAMNAAWDWTVQNDPAIGSREPVKCLHVLHTGWHDRKPDCVEPLTRAEFDLCDSRPQKGP